VIGGAQQHLMHQRRFALAAPAAPDRHVAEQEAAVTRSSA
jgi:hypothetical protein